MARPEFVIDEKILKKVEMLAGQGLTNEQIANTIGCYPSTFYKKKVLKKELKEAISSGKAKGLATITNALFNKAKGGDTAAIKYYLNNRDNANWCEKPEASNEEALPLVINFQVAPAVSEIKVTNA